MKRLMAQKVFISFFSFLSLALLVHSNETFAERKISICSQQAVKELDPHRTLDSASTEGLYLKIYEPLVKRSGRKKVILPLLVKKWTNTGQDWTFTLKEKVSFHSNKYFTPGRYMNAQDIKFSFERFMRLDSKNALIFKEWIKEITINNPYSISFKLKKRGDFLNILLTSAVIMSKEYYEYLEEKNKLNLFTRLPIGTGPFQFEKFKRNSYLRLKTFKNYHFGHVLFDKLEFIKVYKNKMFNMLQFGVCDITLDPSADTLDLIASQPNFKNQSFKIQSTEHTYELKLLINQSIPDLKKQKIKDLIVQALNRPEYIKKLFYEQASLNDSEKNLAYMPSRSQQIIENQQYQFSKPIRLITYYGDKIPNHKKLVYALKDDLATIGIRLKAFKVDATQLVKRINQNNFEIALVPNFNEHKIRIDKKNASISLLNYGDLAIVNKSLKNFYLTQNIAQDFSIIQISNEK